MLVAAYALVAKIMVADYAKIERVSKARTAADRFGQVVYVELEKSCRFRCTACALARKTCLRAAHNTSKFRTCSIRAR